MAAAAVATLLVAAGCGEGGDSDSDDAGAVDAEEAADLLGPEARATGGEPVKVGLISDGSSQVTDNDIEIDVAEATVAWWNEHRSGIGGRPIELVTCVTETDPSRTVDCANQMVEEGVVGVVTGALAAAEVSWSPLHDAGVPVIYYSVNNADMLADGESTFILTNPIAGVMASPLAVAEEEGADKVTVVVIDVPAALSIYEGDGTAAYDEAGVELEIVPVPPGTADMTPQMQDVVNDDPGVIQVVGNDTFCISAFQGLQAAGYDGPINTIAQCVTDATREAVAPEFLEGISMSATTPIGADNPSTQLYRAVIDTYGSDIDPSRVTGLNAFSTVAGFAASLDGISGEINPETVAATIKSMPETELPGAGGLTFRCGGHAVPDLPAVCVRGGLTTVLDEEGQPSEYEVVGQDEEEAAD